MEIIANPILHAVCAACQESYLRQSANLLRRIEKCIFPVCRRQAITKLCQVLHAHKWRAVESEDSCVLDVSCAKENLKASNLQTLAIEFIG